MSCGLEAMVLALQLAKELVDRPWEPSIPVWDHAVYRTPLTPWAAWRAEADAAENRDKKLQEFHKMADTCLSKPHVLIGKWGLFGRDDLTYERGGLAGSLCENCLHCRPDPGKNDEYICE